MARRDFTINAMALPLDGGPHRRSVRRPGRPRAPHDPHRRPDELRRGSPPHRAGAAVRVAARVRPRTGDAWPRWRPGQRASHTSRPSGSVAGSRPTGMGELSKLAPRPRARPGVAPGARHRRAHPDHPRVRSRRSATRSIPDGSRFPLEEHIFVVVQKATDAGARLEVRLACLLHDLGKPQADADGRSHAAVGAEIARPHPRAAAVSDTTCGTTSSASSPATRSRSTGRSTSSLPAGSWPSTATSWPPT